MSEALHDLKMPSFGADMAEGTLVKWLVTEGDKIERGRVIAEIETDKGIIDLDIFENAVIEKLLLKEGERVAVGTPIAKLSSATTDSIETADKDVPPAQNIINDSEKKEHKPAAEIPTVQDLVAAPLTGENEFILATPAARALANKQNLSLHNIKAQNSDKKLITVAMVEAFDKEAAPAAREKDAQTAAQPQAPGKAGFDKEAMRRTISETVTRSKQQIPHYYLSQRLDITALERYLHDYNDSAALEQRILLAAPLLCAIARTLIKNKQLNGLYINGSFAPSNTVHLANAINLRGGGLVMPVIRDAQTLTAIAMMEELKGQVLRARNASLRASELNAASFTVSNIGERGAEQMFAVIYPPQVAIIALGSPHQEAMVIDGGIHIRSIIEATLAADHRVSDGHIGARLLYQLNQQLQKPEELWTVRN